MAVDGRTVRPARIRLHLEWRVSQSHAPLLQTPMSDIRLVTTTFILSHSQTLSTLYFGLYISRRPGLPTLATRLNYGVLGCT